MESVRILTASLVDYAGLFPPAKLSMGESVANYARYAASGDAAMLGRFVLPVSRLSEFAECAKDTLSLPKAGQPWKLSVLLGDNFAGEIPAILKFNCLHWADSPDGHFEIDAVEVKAADEETIERLRAALPDFYRAFVEIPLGENSDETFEAIVRARFSAKIRTGGTDPGAFPSAPSVVEFMRGCMDHGVPFKATAGLHHVVCASYSLTYEPGAARTEMFGYLNLFAAAIFLHSRAPYQTVMAILQETDSRAFEFTYTGLSWRGQKVSLEQIAAARREFAISFGSCSFTEPVGELNALLSHQPSSN